MAGGIKGITIQIGADTAPLNRAVRESEKTAKGLQNELKAVDKALKLDPKNVTLAAQKQELLTKAVAATSDKLGILRQAQEKVNKAHEANADWERQYEPLKKQIDETAKKMTELGRKEQEMKDKLERGEISTEQYQKYKDELDSVTEEHKNLMRSKDELEQQFADGHISDEEYRDYQRTVIETEQRLQGLQRELSETESRAIRVGDGMQQAGERLGKIGSKMSDIGSKLTMGVTMPIVGIGTAAAKMAMDAETSFAKVSTIIDTNSLSYESMVSGVKKASDETGISVTDFAEALYQANSAGVESGQSIAFTTDMVKLAKGGFTDLTKAVDVVTSTLNAYGMSADEAQKVSDQLIMTQNLGKTTVDELASSLGKIIPTANANGVALEDVSTTMAVLTKNGIATAEATTYYNAMLNELGKSGSAADKALREMSGQGFKQLIDSGTPVTEILSMLEEYAADSGKSLSDMFGSMEAGKAALTIMKGNGQEYNEILGKMRKSAGTTEEAFKKMDATPAATMQKELNKLKNVGIDVGGKLLPIVTQGAQLIGKLADQFNKLTPAQQETILKTAGVVAALGPITKIAGTAASGIGTLTKGIGSLVTKFGNMSAARTAADAVGSVGAAAGNATGSVGGFSGILSKLGGPVGIAALAATAIAGIGVALWKAHEDAVNAKIDKAFGSIKLSAEEVEEVAKRLTTTDWTVKLDAYIEAKDKLDEFKGQISEAVATINKLDWKVSVGLELTDAEKESYRQAVSSYVQSSIKWIQQKQYTVSLALEASFDTSSTVFKNLSNHSNNFYNKAQGELKSLGEKLADLMNKAFEENAFDKYAPDMQVIRNQMADKMQELDDMEFEATLDGLKIKLKDQGVQLTKESFEQLNETINDEIEKRLDQQEQIEHETLIQINGQYKTDIENGVTEEAARKLRDYAVSEMRISMAKKTSRLEITGIEVGMNTFVAAYGDQLNSALPDMEKAQKNWINYVNSTWESSGHLNFEGLYNDYSAGLETTMPKMEEDARAAAKMVFEQLEPRRNELEKIANDYLEAGKSVPDYILKGLTDINQIGALGGAIDGQWGIIGKQIAESDEYFNILTTAQANGEKIPQEIIDAIEIYSDRIYDESSGIWRKVTQANVDSKDNVENSARETAKAAPDTAVAEAEAGKEPVAGAFTSLFDLIKQTIEGSDLTTPSEAKGEEVTTGVKTSMEDNKEDVANTGKSVLELLRDRIAGVDVKTTSEIKGGEAVGALDNTLYNALTPISQRGAEFTRSLTGGIMSVDTGRPALQKGEQAGLSMQGGLKSKEGVVKSAGSALSWSGVSGMNAVDTSKGKDWGWDLGANMAAGIRATAESVRSACIDIGNIVKSILGHSVPTDGPMKDDDKWMLHFGENLTAGLVKSKNKVFDQVRLIADGIRRGLMLDDTLDLTAESDLLRMDLVRQNTQQPRQNQPQANQALNINIENFVSNDGIDRRKFMEEAYGYFEEFRRRQERGRLA